MNSYNHYAYGAIGEWMMRALAGIDLMKPGYSEIMLHPRPIEELNFVSAWQDTPYGKVRCEWRVEGALHTVSCTVPTGTTAVLVLEGEGTIDGEAFGRYDTFFIPADAGEIKLSGCFKALLSTL